MSETQVLITVSDFWGFFSLGIIFWKGLYFSVGGASLLWWGQLHSYSGGGAPCGASALMGEVFEKNHGMGGGRGAPTVGNPDH